jgi:hypothetical protein
MVQDIILKADCHSACQKYPFPLPLHPVLLFQRMVTQRNIKLNYVGGSRCNSVSVVTKLQAGQPEFDSRQGLGSCYPRHCVRNGSVTNPGSCIMGTGGFFPGVKAAIA